MNRKALLLAAGVLILPLLLSVSVDEKELKKKSLQAIEFINYEGPHKVIETSAAIKGIGEGLGTAILTQDRASRDSKYTVLRLYDPKAELLSADILILEAAAGVDHIKNLNLIVAGYLEKAFGYTAKDALLMADFITRYNAVYRSDLVYFGSVYQPQVKANLTSETAGLAKSYLEWPGKTRLVIPLRDTVSRGDKGLVNAEEVSQPTVLDQMKKDDPQALDNRKALTDLKEKEIAAEQTAIAKKEDEIKQKEAALDKVAAADGQTPAKDSAAKDSSTAESNPPAKTESAAGVQPAATGPAAADPAKLAEEKKALAEEKKDLEEKKQDNAARDAALAKERKEVAKEEEKRQNGETTAPEAAQTTPALPLVFLKSLGSDMGELQLLDGKTGLVYKKSPTNAIRGGNYLLFQGSILAIVGRDEGDGAIRLYLFKKDDLSVAAQGTDDVTADAKIFTNGTQFYAVTKTDKGEFVLGLFDAALKLVTKGTDAVLTSSSISLAENVLAIQGKAGEILRLDAKTLKRIGN